MTRKRTSTLEDLDAYDPARSYDSRPFGEAGYVGKRSAYSAAPMYSPPFGRRNTTGLGMGTSEETGGLGEG